MELQKKKKIDESIRQKCRIQYSIRIKHPKVITDYDAAWKPIKELSGMFWKQISNVGKSIVQKVNLSNLIDADSGI